MRRRYVTWTWTNWTFGIWWGRVTPKSVMRAGVDLGPLEVVWRWR